MSFPAPPASLTLCSVGPDDAHGADPVRRDLGHQRVQDLQAGGVHHKDFWVMAITKQTSLPLSADGELIELENHRGGGDTCRRDREHNQMTTI